jgi:hypothetical protein
MISFPGQSWVVLSLGLVTLLAGFGCVTPIPAPSGRESQHFSTFESGFRISARDGSVRYMVTLEADAPLETPLFLRVTYQNPADPARPYLEEVEFEAGQELIFLESPPLFNLEADRRYRISIDVFHDQTLTSSSDGHDVQIWSTIDTKSHAR